MFTSRRQIRDKQNITNLKYWMFFKLFFVTRYVFSLCSQLEIYISEGTHSTEEDSECLFMFLLFLLPIQQTARVS